MRLAILPRHIELDKEKNIFNRKHYVNHEFEIMAQKFGIGLCAILSPYDIEDICSICDGLIIPGSNNKVNPSYYGGEAMNPPPKHDDFALDIKVIDCFAKNNKPILGICAGHQAINIYCGGTIGYITNDGSRPHYKTTHAVNIEKGSFIYNALETDRTNINSYHIMHINKLGENLDVVAKSDDGIIEAIEHKEKEIFGVQWHPEESLNKESSPEHKIFKKFIDICRG